RDGVCACLVRFATRESADRSLDPVRLPPRTHLPRRWRTARSGPLLLRRSCRPLRNLLRRRGPSAPSCPLRPLRTPSHRVRSSPPLRRFPEVQSDPRPISSSSAFSLSQPRRFESDHKISWGNESVTLIGCQKRVVTLKAVACRRAKSNEHSYAAGEE